MLQRRSVAGAERPSETTILSFVLCWPDLDKKLGCCCRKLDVPLAIGFSCWKLLFFHFLCDWLPGRWKEGIIIINTLGMLRSDLVTLISGYIIQLYFQTQGPLARNRQYKQKQYTLKKTIMPILPHRGLISHFSKPRICQQHYNSITWIVQPTNQFIHQISH